MNPCCDLDLEDRKPIFFAWHSGSWKWITLSSLATKCPAFQKISSGPTFIDSLKLRCDLDLNAVIHFFNKTLWLMMMYQQFKFGCQRGRQFKKLKQSDFDYKSSRCDLDLKIASQFFSITLRVIMVHHFTKFGFDLEDSKPIFNTPGHNDASQNQVW